MRTKDLINKNFDPTVSTPHSFSKISGLLKKVDIHCIMPQNPNTEKSIKSLRAHMNVESYKLNKKSIKPNFSKNEWNMIKSLKETPNITVAMTDKTNKICIADKSYVEEKQEALTNNSSFTLLSKDPSSKITKSLNNLLSEIFCETDIPAHFWDNLKSQHGQGPELYCLLKDHKIEWPNCKARPVMPIKYSSIERIDIIVSKVLTQFTPYLKYRVTSTDAVREKLKDIKYIDRNDFIFSIDVEAMFPSIPTCSEALKVIEEFLNKNYKNLGIDLYGFKIGHIMKMIEFIFENSYLENMGKFYKILKGLATGSHSSVIIGDIILNDAYIKAINLYNEEPTGLTLFVDDSWGIWKFGKQEFDKFIQILNDIWSGLNFIPVLEDINKTIIFLDLKIYIDSTFKIQYEHYVKPTSSRRYLHFDSHNPMSMKTNIVRMEAERIIKNCSEIKNIYNHLDNLKMAFENSGYPSQFINNIFLPIIQRAESGKTLQPKDKRTPHEFLLVTPYVNEKFTRIVKSKVKKLNINAKVIVKSGRKLKSHLKSKSPQNCQCIPCELGVPCKTRNYVYESTCLHCSETYIGASARPDIDKKGRISEYESSLRLPQQNQRTTLGRHKKEFHPDSPNNIKENFSFKIAAKANDSLELFLKEGLLIKKHKPQINGKFLNGYII